MCAELEERLKVGEDEREGEREERLPAKSWTSRQLGEKDRPRWIDRPPFGFADGENSSTGVEFDRCASLSAFTDHREKGFALMKCIFSFGVRING